MKVLVLGAAADQGVPLLHALIGRGHEVTAGVRRANAMAATPFAHIPSVFADICDEEALVAAMRGQDALAMHLPFEFDRARAAAFGTDIANAARRGASRKSFSTRAVSLRTTILGCRRMTGGAISSAPLPKICLDDVAAYMVRALESNDMVADRVAVGGPEALTGDEAAERLSVAAGRPVRFQSLAPDEFAASMSLLVTGSREVGPHSIYDGTARFYAWYNAQPRSPLALDPSAALERLPIAPTSFDSWAPRQDWSA